LVWSFGSKLFLELHQKPGFSFVSSYDTNPGPICLTWKTDNYLPTHPQLTTMFVDDRTRLERLP